MITMRRSSRLLMLFTLLGGALATELLATEQPATEQPVLLPMPELLKHLDQNQEWLMLPLAEYQTLIAAGKIPQAASDNHPTGSWIEMARITGMLRDDRRLVLRAELEVVAAAAEVSRCRLFARLPSALGSTTLAGGPALTALRDDGGMDLLLPGPGRRQAVVTWTVDLIDAAEGSRVGSVPLPLAAGLDVTLESVTPGMLLGAGLSTRSDQRWTLNAPIGSDLVVAWHPGRQGGDEVATWGIEQTVQVALPNSFSAPRAWRWNARPTVLRGQLPLKLTVHLPAGWIVTKIGGGVLDVQPVADGVRVRIDPATDGLQLEGVAEATANLALPDVEGAIWQGGRLVLIDAQHVDWQLPVRWRRLPTVTSDDAVGAQVVATDLDPRGLRVFAVPGPDTGLKLVPTTTVEGLSSRITTTVAIGAERWRMETQLVVQAGDDACFSLPIRLPDGWRALSATCSVVARIAGASADSGARGSSEARGALSDSPVDGVLHIDLPQGLKPARSVTITVVLERDAASEPQVCMPPVLLGAERINQRLIIVSAPSLELQIAGSGWQRTTDAVISTSPAASALRTVLETVGDAPPLTLFATVKPAVCEAEVVTWLLPLSGPGDGQPDSQQAGKKAADVWCRLDLRLTVSDGELDTLDLTLPLVPDTVQLTDPTLAIVREGGRTLLRASRPWRGERLVRIEGRLATPAGPRMNFPQMVVKRIDGQSVPIVQHVALQAPERLDLRLEPGTAAKAEDEDDLPHWAHAIPGESLAGVWRITPGDAGGFVQVSRPLADPPAGFVHRLDVRTQLTADRQHTLLRFRLAAPGLSPLSLQLPADCTLVAATLDGRAVAVRRAAGNALLPLPGRTQVDVALLLDAPLPDGVIEIGLPGLGGLPVTSLTWMLAADPTWRLVPTLRADALQIFPIEGMVATRPWFASWRNAAGQVETDVTPATRAALATAAQVPDDSRQLSPLPTHVTFTGEPTLALAGQLWRGERLGGNAKLVLSAEPLAELRRMDHLGAALVVLLGAWLAWRLRPLATVALAAAAFSGAFALHAAGLTCGPLLAACEWLMPVLLVVALVRRLTVVQFFRLPQMSVPSQETTP